MAWTVSPSEMPPRAWSIIALATNPIRSSQIDEPTTGNPACSICPCPYLRINISSGDSRNDRGRFLVFCPPREAKRYMHPNGIPARASVVRWMDVSWDQTSDRIGCGWCAKPRRYDLRVARTLTCCATCHATPRLAATASTRRKYPIPIDIVISYYFCYNVYGRHA
jgi:hypothetical protein